MLNEHDERERGSASKRSDLLRSWAPRPWLLLGIGYYFAWMVLVVFNFSELITQPVVRYPEILVRTSFSSTVTLGLVLAMFFSKKFDVLSSGKWILAFAAGSSAMGTTLLVFSLNYISSVALLVTSTLLIGFGNAILLLSWGELFQRLSPTRLAGHVAVSCLAASCICAASSLLPAFAYNALVVALPVASGITLIFCPDNWKDPRVREASWAHGLTKILISCVVAGIFLGIVRTFPVFGSTLQTQGSFIYLMMIIVFVACLALLFAVGYKSPILLLYRFCIPVLIIGYGLLAVGSPLLDALSLVFVMSGNILFEGLVLLVCPFIVIRMKMSLVHLFGWSAVALHCGSFIGLQLGSFLIATSPSSNDGITLFSVLAVIALMFLFFFVFKELDIVNFTKDGEETAFSEGATQEGCLDDLAVRHRLSPRETEVLRLLANGRSLPYIEKELVISHSTAKTHVRHIYEKLDIKNRQELHDLAQGNRQES